MIGILLLLFIILIIVFLYSVTFIKSIISINKQLDFIANHDTNAEINSTSSNKTIRNLADNLNSVIKQNKKQKELQVQRENEFYETLSSISHDLRTPLTTAYGYSQLLPREIDLSSKIEQSLKDTNTYLNYLVDYTNIYEKKERLEYVRMNVSKELSQDILQYYDALTKKGININLDIDKDIKIISDTIIFKRIIQNIISNILKYAKSYAKVSLKEYSNETVITSINDVSEDLEYVDRIINRFVTNDKSRSNKSVGLGINIIKECAELLQGTMDIEYSNEVFKIIIRIPIRNINE